MFASSTWEVEPSRKQLIIMAAVIVTDVASLCLAADLTEDDLRGCQPDELEEIFEEFEVKVCVR